MPDEKELNNAGCTIGLIGAGGNIGSHAVAHLARMAGVERILLVDRDIYEEKNLASQDIMPGDVGKPKVAVQAARIRRINPHMKVVAIHDEIQNVPLGRLRCAVILSGLDSREARRYLNEAVWHLGVPWIDAAVDGAGLLARINVYAPKRCDVCMECAWDQNDYDALEQEYPCTGRVDGVAATNAPSSVGALAASLQTIECRKVLADQWPETALGKQVLLDALHHRQYVTSFRRNGQCRFEHDVWNIAELPRESARLTVREALDSGGRDAGGSDGSALRVEGDVFVRNPMCPACKMPQRIVHLRRRLNDKMLRCAGCGAAITLSGADMVEEIRVGDLPRPQSPYTLGTLGLREGDVFDVAANGRTRHYMIGNGSA